GLSIRAAARLPSTLACRPQAHYIVHDPPHHRRAAHGDGSPFALWRPSSGPQSLPIDPEMFGTKAPRTSRDGQHPTFQTVPPRPPLSLFSSWIARLVCSICHTRRADTRAATSRFARSCKRTSAATRGKKAHFFVKLSQRKRDGRASLELLTGAACAVARVDVPPNSAPLTRGFFACGEHSGRHHYPSTQWLGDVLG